MDAFGRVVNPIMEHVVNPLIGLAFAVAVIVFAYGVLQMVFKEPGSEGHDKGKASILWGAVGMAIMLSAWGIIYLISNTVNQF